MANWYGETRTNYFKVTDEARYQELFQRLVGEEEIEDFSSEFGGELYHAFGSYCDICFIGVDEDGKPDYNIELEYFDFLKEISKILTKDSCLVLTCVGHEKLRYLTGICSVVFPNGKITEMSLDGFAISKVQRYFGKDYDLRLDY